MKRFLFFAIMIVFMVCIFIGTSQAWEYLYLYESSDNCKVIETQYIEGDLEQTLTFIYDNKGNLKEVRDNNQSAVQYYIYNSSGQLQKTELFWRGELEEISYYYYKADGRIGREEWDCWGDGDICEIYDYKYSDGRLIERNSRSYDDEYDKYLYDASGRIIGAEFHCCNEVMARTILHYDSGGKIEKIEYHDLEDGTFAVEIVSWDCSGSGGGGNGCFIRTLR